MYDQDKEDKDMEKDKTQGINKAKCMFKDRERNGTRIMFLLLLKKKEYIGGHLWFKETFDWHDDL